MNRYQYKIDDNGDIFWGGLKTITFPKEPYKYIQTSWIGDYTWRRLAYLVYGDPDMYWIILAANDITNPYDIELGDDIKVLKQEYINELNV